MIDVHGATLVRSALWEKGFRPIPVYNPDAQVASAGKRPKGTAWQEAARETPPHASKARPDADALNTGILADGLRAIDIDVDSEGVAGKVRDLAVSTLGAAPERFRSNSERVLLLYRAASGSPHKRVLNGADGDKIEVLGHGNQFVAYGFHPSGEDLSWLGGFPGLEMGLDDLTPVTEDQITDFFNAAATLIGAPPVAATEMLSFPSGNSSAPRLDDIKAALNVTTALADSYDSWIRIGLAIHAETSGSNDGFALWDEWSRTSAKYSGKAAMEAWRSFSPRGITIASLFHAAKEAVPGWRAPSWDEHVEDSDDSREDAAADTRTPSLAILSNRKFPARPLALSAFGPFWSGWISDAAQASSAPPDYTAIPLLTVAAGLIGNSRKAQVWYGWQEPCVLWAGTVGEPSAGKTPGAAPVMSGMVPIIESHMARDFPEQRDEWITNQTHKYVAL